MTRDINVLALVKGEERYVFLFDDNNRSEALRTLGRFASNPELSFTWYDAAVLSQKIRRLTPATSNASPRFNISLPTDMQMQVMAGLPNTAATVPDGFGNGVLAIDFDQGVAGGGIKNQVMFMPDGSAHDVNGNWNSGIVYVLRPGDLYSARAVTLYGATGRIRGWRLLSSPGGPQWFQQ